MRNTFFQDSAVTSGVCDCKTFGYWMFLFLFLVNYGVAAEGLSVEQVFWGWDDGLLTYEQVEELLGLLEREDETEACALWYAYTGEICAGYEVPGEFVDIPRGGRAGWRASLDSTGSPYAQTVRGEFNYGRFDLKLLWKGDTGVVAKMPVEGRLRYRDKKAEAVFGTLTRADLESPFPIREYFGYAGHLQISQLGMGALLAADSSMGFRLGAGNKKTLFVSGMGVYQRDNQSGFLRVLMPGAELGVGWNEHWDTPLVFAKFRYAEKEVLRFQWNGSLYWHENDTLEGPFQLVRSIVKNEWWVVQRQSIQWNQWKYTWVERAYIPHDSGFCTMTGSFAAARKKADAAVGATVFFAQNTDAGFALKYQLESGIRLRAAESLFVKLRWQNEWLPRWTLGVLLIPHPRVSLQNMWIINARWTESSPLVFRHVTQIKQGDHWGCSLRFDWKITRSGDFIPNRFGFSLEGSFLPLK